jgi:hypothetical protein
MERVIEKKGKIERMKERGREEKRHTQKETDTEKERHERGRCKY